MGILLGVILLFALLSGALAAGQAMAISRLASASGPSWRDWLFGWWRFERISGWAGLTGEVQAAIYRRAVIACLVFIIFGLILSGWVVNQRGETAEVGAVSLNDWRVLPAHLAEHSDIRRAADVPGALILES
ncbi:hypothetical protein VW35_13465 [Devosia soli]|uniref:Uncharacterized protein n=1 Tax=Devosia soli TaxID=361041 RepID=A0A0F5L7C6_9HYPH|nr:hypothetical protein [Devosia soli]KKB78104.1 hypothetical protein VW35_13465 [Devosia soli]